LNTEKAQDDFKLVLNIHSVTKFVTLSSCCACSCDMYKTDEKIKS